MTAAASEAVALVDRVASRLSEVRGVRAVALGGSFARGTADAASDLDLGVYYAADEPLDLSALRELARELDPAHGRDAVTEPGEWGPWINGGAWLTIEGRRVDWLYRELGRVESVIEDCRAGRFTTDYQPGHPHAFHSYMYLAEVALGRPLSDRAGALARLRSRATPYPPLLKSAIVDRFLWEARFALDMAIKPADRGEAWYVAGSLFRSVACLAQVLYALNERYFLNEKGALLEVAGFERVPGGFGDTVQRVFAARGANGERLRDRVDEVHALVDEVERLAADERPQRAV